MSGQGALELRRLQVVRNCWGPEWHVQWEDGYTAWPEAQPRFFDSLDEALAFARAHGVEPEIDPEGGL